MLKIYLCILFFLIFPFIRCKVDTKKAVDKIDKERHGDLLSVDECFFLFIKEGLIKYNKTNIPIDDFKAKSGSCSKEKDVGTEDGKNIPQIAESMIKFTAKATVGKLSEIEFTIKVLNNLKTDYWAINEVLVTGLEEEEVKLTGENHEIPIQFSYHCGKLELYKFKYQNESSDFSKLLEKITLSDFQIQPFKGKVFVDDSFDCETWFTIGTFSGLILLILFTSILAFGICYIIRIKTNDRFEDPKGKPLVIGNVDS